MAPHEEREDIGSEKHFGGASKSVTGGRGGQNQGARERVGAEECSGEWVQRLHICTRWLGLNHLTSLGFGFS